MKINLGCGKTVIPDFDGLDILDFGQKYVMSVFDYIHNNWMRSNYIDEIQAHHFLEHFDQAELREILNFCHRALKPNCVFYAEVPHKNKDQSFILSHKTYWTEATFEFLAKVEEVATYGFKCWEIKKLVTNERLDIHCWMVPVK